MNTKQIAQEMRALEESLRDSYEVPNTVLRDVPQPLVSVRTSTYQHAAYIKECIDAVLAQKTPFSFEYLIGEDYSTDGTREIVMQCAQEHPGLIRLVTADRNVGFRANGRRTVIRSRGKYMAICEGDDLWIDPHKLADQVAILEADLTLSACVSDAWNETDGIREPFNHELERLASGKGYIELSDLLKENIAPTASIVIRVSMLTPPHPNQSRAPAGDWLLLIRLALQGPIGILNRKSVVRRRHAGGRISMKDDVSKGLFTVACLTSIREMVPAAEQAIIDERVNGLNRTAIELAYQKGGRDAALKVWGTFKGRGFDAHQRWRWWMLLHFPGLMRVVGKLRSRR